MKGAGLKCQGNGRSGPAKNNSLGPSYVERNVAASLHVGFSKLW